MTVITQNSNSWLATLMTKIVDTAVQNYKSVIVVDGTDVAIV